MTIVGITFGGFGFSAVNVFKYRRAADGSTFMLRCFVGQECKARRALHAWVKSEEVDFDLSDMRNMFKQLPVLIAGITMDEIDLFFPTNLGQGA